MSEPLQRDLFTDRPPPRITDGHVTAAERPRLSAQCLAVLDRLEQGPATNFELAQIALRFGARVLDLRAAGYVIEIVETDYGTGRRVYELKGGG